jgi:trehalose synthase-fused probable maltokinase
VIAAPLERIGEAALADFVSRGRWFGAKTREVTGVRVLAAPVLREGPPGLVLALVEVRFETGSHELYQLPLGVRPAGWWDEGVVGEADGTVVYDALLDAELVSELVRLMREGAAIEDEDEDAHIELSAVDGAELLTGPWTIRPMGAEQSNTSVVLGEELVLKAYRRLEAGVNPELELLRFLTERGFPNVPALAGWYAYSGRLMDATLGILQRYVPAEQDGWGFALESLAEDPERFLAQARQLGEVTGQMHLTLASDSSDPAFAPEEPSAESLGLLTATIDEEIAEAFASLPELDALEPIAGRGEEVREGLRLVSHAGPLGRSIRQHGDYHLGQVLWTGSDWIVIDFEGEPARPLPERRRKRSALRDVAGMLRSFAYAASASELGRGAAAPEDWEERAREEFLGGYLPVVEPLGLLPAGRAQTARLLAVFELEKAVYELRYELDHRPDWVSIPVAGIVRLLESDELTAPVRP